MCERSLLKEESKGIRVEIKSTLEEVHKAVKEGDEQKADLYFGLLKRFGRLEKIARKMEEKGRTTYVFSTLFLKKCFARAMKSDKEEFFYISGVKIGNCYVPTEILNFDYAKQSKTGVTSDLKSTTEALIKLDKHDHLLIGYLHSHPGKGPGATTPSSIDDREQKKLERDGYSAIGCIFSEDGFFRFYSLSLDFEIHIYGKGVKEVGRKVYRFEK